VHPPEGKAAVTIDKGPPLYRTEAVLDGSQLSNSHMLYGSFVYFHSPDALPSAPTLDNVDPLFALVAICTTYRWWIMTQSRPS